jgi:uncharacterized protein YhdP
MIHRFARLLLEIVGVLIGGFLVVAGILAWRLSSAPVEGSFIRPYVEQAINSAGLGVQVEMAGAKLGWHRFRPTLDFRVHGVKIVGEGGAAIGAFQEATLGISLRDLLLGRISLTEIDIERPEITLIRDADDRFLLRIGKSETGGDNNLQNLIDSLEEAPNDRTSIGRFRRIRIVDGKVEIDDKKLNTQWSAPDVDIDIQRTETETSAHLHATLALPSHDGDLYADLRHSRSDGRTSLSLHIVDFDAAAAAPLAPILAPLSTWAVSVTGSVNAVLDDAGNLISGDAQLASGQGRLVLPDYYTDPLAIRSLGLAVHFGNAPKSLVIDNIALDLGDAKLSLQGTANFDGPQVAVAATFGFSDIPMARLDAIWPRGVATGGRDWVTTHIVDGAIKSGTAHIETSGKIDDLSSFQSVAVNGAFDFDGFEIHYFPPLPPGRAIGGHATFDARRMDLTLEKGLLGDIAASDGAVAITGFDQDDRSIDIDLTLDGPLKTALSVLDTKPLLYAHKLGFPPEAAAGHLRARVKFAFPLLKDLPFSLVTLGATGKLDGVAVAAAIGTRDVSGGAMDLSVDKKSMTLAGTARLSGVPLTFDWKEFFEDSAKFRSQINLRGDLDDAARTALKIDVSDIVAIHGKLPVIGRVTIDRAHNTIVDGTADLTAAELTVDALEIRKPAEPGSGRLSLTFSGDTLRQISKLQIDSPSMKLTGNVDFAGDGSFQHAEMPHLLAGRNDYAITANAEPGVAHAFAISVKGVSFDAAPFLADQSSASPPQHAPRLDIGMAVDHLLTGANTGLDAVQGSITLSGSRLDRADIKAVAGKDIAFTYMPGDHGIDLHFAAADAGATLKGLGLTKGVRGGTLKLDGVTTGGQAPRLTNATLDMRDFRLVNAPITARLINAVSLTGFVDLLSGQGLNFDHLSSEMDYADGKITFRDGRIAGALGLSFEGDVDLSHDKIALKGTIVPADTVNRVLAAIPVLGDLLTGGARGGLIGWTYTVRGSPNDPTVSVNPLSMLAPGFLRNMFFLGRSEPEAKAAPEPPSVAPSVTH